MHTRITSSLFLVKLILLFAQVFRDYHATSFEIISYLTSICLGLDICSTTKPEMCHILYKQNVLLTTKVLLSVYNLLIMHNIALYCVVLDARMEVHWSCRRNLIVMIWQS